MTAMPGHDRDDRDGLDHLHHQIMRVLAMRHHTGDAMVDREDLAQTAWLRILERPRAFEGRSSFRTFAVGVALNVQREVWNRAARRRRIAGDQAHALREALSNEPLGPDFDTGCEHEHEHERERLHRAVAQLDERERWLLDQRMIEDRSYERILPDFRARFGARLSTTEGLRSLFFRARRRLESLLTAERTTRAATPR